MHLIDFGFANKLIDEETGKHIKEGDSVEQFQGNLYFSSFNQMNFKKTSAKDDMISVFYLVLLQLSPNVFEPDQSLFENVDKE